MLIGARGKKLSALLEKYKFVLLVILVGVILLLLPSGGAERGAAGPEGGTSQTVRVFDLEAMEKRMADALSEIDGAGRVTVILTIKSGNRKVLAEDTRENESSAVVVSRGSGYQEAVTVQEFYPEFQGALVVCPGGGDPAVRLKLAEAVSALTGLGSNKISICKGK
ncbi:MAG: stage III sporulation protein AG [Clostridiales bacterium]|nr:stage III sporulation protein AG [Clostridiales bacterium]